MPTPVDVYRRALDFAARAHAGQKMSGSELPYLLHLAHVGAEINFALENEAEGFDENLCLQVGILHDVLEDTDILPEELAREFSEEICLAVQALSKNKKLPKAQQMADSLKRIKANSKEACLVKLADRLVNMSPPPHYWSAARRKAYQEDARMILAVLGGTHAYLEARLAQKIEDYSSYIEEEDGRQ